MSNNSSMPANDPAITRLIQGLVEGASIPAQKKLLENMVLTDYSKTPHLRALQVMISSAWLMVSDLARDIGQMSSKVSSPGYNKGDYIIDTTNIETSAAFITTTAAMVRILIKDLSVTNATMLSAVEALGHVEELVLKEKTMFVAWLPVAVGINPKDPVSFARR